MSRGKFVTIEGPDGSGKTSVITLLKEKLLLTEIEAIFTREPGGSPIAEQIRKIILDINNTAMDARTEALLYAASRRQHLVETIIPAVKAGRLVISDRFVHSSLAYQGMGREIGMEEIWQINQFAIQDRMPDLTLLIDVPAEIGIQRIEAAKGERQYDRLDREKLEFHHKVRQTYLDLASNNDKIIIIDGTKSVAEVSEACFAILLEHGII